MKAAWTTLAIAVALASAATASMGPRVGDDGRGARLEEWRPLDDPALIAAASALRSARAADAPPPAELAARIAAAGPRSIDACIEILVRGRVPQAVEGEAPQLLSDPQRAIVLEALRVLPEDAVRASMRRARANEPGEAADLAAIHVLEAVGGGRDLEWIGDLAFAHERDGRLPRSFRSALRSACAVILARRADAWPAAKTLVERAPVACVREILWALASRRDPRAVPLLHAAAQAHPELVAQAASTVVACGGSSSLESDRRFSAWLVDHLSNARPECRRQIVRALGVLDDGVHARVLVAGLEDEDAGTREAALWALRRQSGLELAGDPASWRAWLDGASRWFDEERERTRELLKSRQAGAVAAALASYQGQRFRRSDLALDVVEVLDRDEAQLRALACGVLAELKSSAAIPALVRALDDTDSTVASTARRVLRDLSGLDFPQGSEAAFEALGEA